MKNLGSILNWVKLKPSDDKEKKNEVDLEMNWWPLGWQWENVFTVKWR